MDLKESLKKVKTNESSISMIIGIIVILAVGLLVVRYFRNIDRSSTLPPFETEISDESLEKGVHIVKTGESLWLIAEREYGEGYMWARIAEANNIISPSGIEEGQKLVIPASIEMEEELATTETEPSAEPTLEPTTEPTQPPSEPEKPETDQKSYTVVKGDHLWGIAERIYGDGTRWVDIARENNLANPDLIHSGNVFILPN